jgi:hypothetical protein
VSQYGILVWGSNLTQTRNKIIQKGLAFVRERSGSVTAPGTTRAWGSAPS